MSSNVVFISRTKLAIEIEIDVLLVQAGSSWISNKRISIPSDVDCKLVVPVKHESGWSGTVEITHKVGNTNELFVYYPKSCERYVVPIPEFVESVPVSYYTDSPFAFNICNGAYVGVHSVGGYFIDKPLNDQSNTFNFLNFKA